MLINNEGFKTYKSGLKLYTDKGLRLYYVYGRIYLLTGKQPLQLDPVKTEILIQRYKLFN